jgi:hypothetical protein
LAGISVDPFKVADMPTLPVMTKAEMMNGSMTWSPTGG